MWHPDDGDLHALLDGELTGDARMKVESHLRSCADCEARYREAKTFAVEANSLVNAIDVPPARTPWNARLPGRRRIPLTTLAWAATLVLAAGLGYWGRDTIRRTAPTELQKGDRPAAGAESVATAPPMSKIEPAESGMAADRLTSGDDKERAADKVPPPVAAVVAPEAASKAASKAAPAEEGRQAANLARVSEPPMQAKPSAPVVGGVAAAEGRREDEATTSGWRSVTMEQAVQVLGGAVRLVDGLTPERFDVGPGTLVPGGDPTREVVRVVYAEGAIILDQQRTEETVASRRAARYDDAAAKRIAAQPAAEAIEWRSSDGFRYVVTGTVGADSLKALTARVR